MQETQETRVRSLGQEESLEKEMATHSSVLAWRTPRREEPGGLYPQGHVESDWAFKPASASKQYEKPLEGTKEKTDMIWAMFWKAYSGYCVERMVMAEADIPLVVAIVILIQRLEAGMKAVTTLVPNPGTVRLRRVCPWAF